MNLVQEFLIFFIVSFISFVADKNKCPQGNLILFIHHFVNIFANFGWLATNRILLQIYLFVPIIVLGHWMVNDNNCILTQLYNNLCNTPGKKFNDVFDEIGLKDKKWWNDYGHASFLIIGYGIALYKLGYIQ